MDFEQTDFSSLGDDMKTDTDEVLSRLREVVNPIVTEVDEDMDTERAVFILGAKEITDSDGDYAGVQTYIDLVGDYGVLQEALYSELMDMIQNQQPEFFEALREVVKNIEEELDISDGTPLAGENRTVH